MLGHFNNNNSNNNNNNSNKNNNNNNKIINKHLKIVYISERHNAC